jgi:hypothetical protein
LARISSISRPDSPRITAPAGRRDDQRHAQDRVDPGKHVGPHDFGNAAGGAPGNIVAVAFGYPLGHLGIGQAFRQPRVHRVNVPSLLES